MVKSPKLFAFTSTSKRKFKYFDSQSSETALDDIQK